MQAPGNRGLWTISALPPRQMLPEPRAVEAIASMRSRSLRDSCFSLRMHARSMTFLNSRMLPAQRAPCLQHALGGRRDAG